MLGNTERAGWMVGWGRAGGEQHHPVVSHSPPMQGLLCSCSPGAALRRPGACGDPVEPPPHWHMCRDMGTLPHALHWANSSPGMASLGASSPAPVVTVPGPQPPSPACLCVGGRENHRASVLRRLDVCEVQAAPALSPGPSHRLLWANKPQAEAQLVTGVPRLPQPRGRNTVSQVQAPARSGCRWVDTQQGPLVPAHDTSFGVLSQAQGKVQPNPLLFLPGADSSVLLTHTVAGETQRGPKPFCIGGVQ